MGFEFMSEACVGFSGIQGGDRGGSLQVSVGWGLKHKMVTYLAILQGAVHKVSPHDLWDL